MLIVTLEWSEVAIPFTNITLKINTGPGIGGSTKVKLMPMLEDFTDTRCYTDFYQ